jgi:hypothetical protein
MPNDKPMRRLPLRDLLTDAEKRTRDLLDHMTGSWLSRASDLRELSRPLRKRSSYPTLQSLQNAIHKMVHVSQETEALVTMLIHELDEINEHARRERLNRT